MTTKPALLLVPAWQMDWIVPLQLAESELAASTELEAVIQSSQYAQSFAQGYHADLSSILEGRE